MHAVRLGRLYDQPTLDALQQRHGDRWVYRMLQARAAQDDFVGMPLLRPDTPDTVLATATHYFELYDFVNVPSDQAVQPDAGQLDTHTRRLLIALPARVLHAPAADAIVAFLTHLQVGALWITDCCSQDEAQAVIRLSASSPLSLVIDVQGNLSLWEHIYKATVSGRTALALDAAELERGSSAEQSELWSIQDIGLLTCQTASIAIQLINAAGTAPQLAALPLGVWEEAGFADIPRQAPLGDKMSLQDVLMSPLEPLADNLPSSLYFAMEADHTKYRAYQAAIRAALVAREETRRILIVGAGRGPLVESVLQLSEQLQVPVVAIVVVEKNPNAFATLYHRKRSQWDHRYPALASCLELHLSTIKDVDLPTDFRADMIISELLGSFGDNELAPECMVQAHRFLSPRGTVIPASSTSHLLPVHYPRVRRVLAQSAQGPAAQHCPAVVYTTGAVHLARDKAPVFHYDYACLEACGEGERAARLQWTVPALAALDGFMGYFEAHLFGDQYLSISPYSQHGSAGGESWFPLFFPLSSPRADREEGPLTITLTITRVSQARHAWYEWQVEDAQGIIGSHNPLGVHYRIRK